MRFSVTAFGGAYVKCAIVVGSIFIRAEDNVFIIHHLLLPFGRLLSYFLTRCFVVWKARGFTNPVSFVVRLFILCTHFCLERHLNGILT